MKFSSPAPIQQAGLASARPAAAQRRFPGMLLLLFLLFTAVLGIRPISRSDWLLENLIVLLALPALIYGAWSLRISRLAYAGVFIFFCLHEVGAHYTYSLVPYDSAFREIFGRGLNELLGWERNHFDRLVHFLYGFLMMPYTLDLFAERAPPQKLWRFLMPVFFVMGHSALYELLEWGAALVFGGDLGQAFLGTQGDIWDAQKDTALATLGACLSIGLLNVSGLAPKPIRPVAVA
jgi:putative membrane protein